LETSHEPEPHCRCCLWRAIRYTCNVALAVTGVRHCRNCQKQTGEAFSTLLGIPKGGLQVSGDKPRRIETVGESELKVSRAFC
jgi:hypothetical protein